MCSRVVCGVIAVLASGCAGAPLPAPESAAEEESAPAPVAAGDMPGEVRALLQRRCAGCHVAGPGDAGGWGSVLDVPRMIEARIVVPGDPRASSLIGQLLVGEMPRRGPRLRPREVELLERWIRGLASVALARSR
jgi:mono/diheme cytochrome c family protein